MTAKVVPEFNVRELSPVNKTLRHSCIQQILDEDVAHFIDGREPVDANKSRLERALMRLRWELVRLEAFLIERRTLR